MIFRQRKRVFLKVLGNKLAVTQVRANMPVRSAIFLTSAPYLRHRSRQVTVFQLTPSRGPRIRRQILGIIDQNDLFILAI